MPNINQSKLKTGWVIVATAGNTVDGRQIKEQDLKDVAATYDLKEYTAIINSDHEMWYGNFGYVESVRLSKNKKNRTTLEAILVPNSRLIEKNKYGQGVFTSVELWPNFAKTGRTYLSGLAVTDSPASLGTTYLQFKNNNKEKGNDFLIAEITENQEKILLFDDEATKEQHKINNFITACSEFFNKPKKEIAPMATKNITKYSDEEIGSIAEKVALHMKNKDTEESKEPENTTNTKELLTKLEALQAQVEAFKKAIPPTKTGASETTNNNDDDIY